jgi:hypothetical protein
MSATVTHSDSAKNAATNAVTALLGASSKLVFNPTGGSVASPGAALATLPFTTPNAFGAATGGIATAAAITSDSNAAGGGTAAFATFQTSASAAIVRCAVAASGSDINMTNGLVINAGDIVSCSSLTYAALSQ